MELDGIFVRKKGFIDKKAEGAADTPLVLSGKTSADHPASHEELHFEPIRSFEAMILSTDKPQESIWICWIGHQFPG
jgi:hypothetical protein